MAELNLPNIRKGGDITFRVSLEDGGVAVDWSALEEKRAFLYNDGQRLVSGECTVAVDPDDSTVLVCQYSGDDRQYLGVNSVVVRAKYRGRLKVYDKKAVNIVGRTSAASGVVVIEDPVVPVQLSVEDVSTTLLENAIAAAIGAAARATAAAEAAEHMVDIHTGPQGPAGKSPYIDETTGHWFIYDDETGEYVDSGNQAQGETGNGIASWSVVESQEDGGSNVVTVTFTDGTSETFTYKNGHTGATPAISIGTVETGEPGTPAAATMTGTAAAPVLNLTIPKGQKGDQGNSGYQGAAGELEVVNNLTDGGSTAALSAEMGKTLEGEVTQLEAKVDEVMPKQKAYEDFSNIASVELGSYSNKEYRTIENTRVRCVSYLPNAYITENGATKLRLTVGSGYQMGRQLLSSTFESISGTIAVGSAEVFNDGAWQTGTVELDLTQYPTAKTFGFVIRADTNRVVSPTEDFGIKVELYANSAWINIDERIDSKIEDALSEYDNELQEVEDEVKDIYIPSTEYSLDNIGSSLARGQFDVTPGHHYTIKVTPWDYTGMVSSGSWIIVFEDGYLSGVVLGGTMYPNELPPSYQFIPTQSVVGVSSRGVVGSEVNLEIIDEDTKGVLNKTIDRVYALENEEDEEGAFTYVGEKIDLKNRTYDKESFFVTSQDDFTVIKDTIVTQMGKSLVMQSCAVYGKYFVRAYQYGGIAVYDLETKSLVADFMLPLPSEDLLTLHASNISFGVEFPSGNTIFPAFYVCETTGQRRCFVFNLTLSSATLLQTITFDGTWGTGNDYRDFIVDSQKRCLWIIGYYNYGASGNYSMFKRVDLRSISASTISYNDADVIQSFDIHDITVIQGVFISNGRMYLGDQRRYIDNIDLVQGKIVGYIDFSSFLAELEGLATYDGCMLVDSPTVYKLTMF